MAGCRNDRLPALRVVFFGSPDFAVPSLDGLLATGHEVLLVVSQPARPVGRHALPVDPPVVLSARAAGIEVWQPETLRGEEALSRLASIEADLFVVVAYGRILGPRTLALPRLGALNVHGSLLPRWRGASPVQAALLAGDAETGVSLMRMDTGMDTGPVYAVDRTRVEESDDAVTLGARLARMGAGLLAGSLPAIERGLAPRPQDDGGATVCGKTRREDGRVDWRLAAFELSRRGRAFTPWPGLYCLRAGRRLKLLEVKVTSGREGAEAGLVLEAGERVVVACGQGALEIGNLQLEGRRSAPAREFSAGSRLAVGEVFS